MLPRPPRVCAALLLQPENWLLHVDKARGGGFPVWVQEALPQWEVCQDHFQLFGGSSDSEAQK